MSLPNIYSPPPQPALKYHEYLTIEYIVELLEHAEPDWSPRCATCNSVSPNYVARAGDLLCSDCVFCRECGAELEYTWCPNHECKLYLESARLKDSP